MGISQYSDNDDIRIKGATDESLISNTGTSLDVNVTNTIPVVATVSDGPNQDAFGRLRVSEPHSILEYSFRFDKGLLQFDESTATGGTSTHSANDASVQMAVTSSSGSSVIRQGKVYVPYHPGKSQLVEMSGNMGTVRANCRKRMGVFDTADGLFFEQDGSTLRVVVRSSTSGSAVDTQINQSSWNLDALDGTGASEVTLDTSKQNIYIIDYQWLGSGRVRFGVNIHGSIIYCHEFLNGNVGSTVYMKTGSLPIRHEITNTAATAGSTTMLMTCGTVISEGGWGPNGILRSTNNGVTLKTISNSTNTPLISLRLNSAFVKSALQILDIQIFCQTVDDLLFQIHFNPTLTGASWASVASGSSADVDVAATTLSGGIVVHSGYIRGAGSAPSIVNLESALNKVANSLLGSNLAGTADILTVSCRGLTTTASALGSITFREIY